VRGAPRTILAVLHQEASETGRVGTALLSLGYQLEICRPICGETLPRQLDAYAGVVVFGGPMSANDEHLEGIRAELDWIPTALAAETPFLGICLGGQLLSRALGGSVAPHPDGLFEIGFYDIESSRGGCELFPAPARFYQFHGEGFTLPAGCERLATGGFFENQAFRHGGNAYGLQFHPEVTAPMLRQWTTMVAHRLTLPGAQCRKTQWAEAAAYDAVATAWLQNFLPRWLESGRASQDQTAR